MKTCPNCHQAYSDDNAFCVTDGTPLAAPAAPAPQAAPPAADPHARLACEWCGLQNMTNARSCSACGAPLDVKNLVTDSGWREAPRLRDMTEIRFGNSTCQVEGDVVPVAEIALQSGDSVYFEHHTMLWKDEPLHLGLMPTTGGIKRLFAGMPFVISIASGPGRIAFSRDATGEMVVLPMHPNTELDVREHAFLVASHTIEYTFLQVKGLMNILFGGQGMFMDRFVAKGQQGLLILHGYGNVFERTLKAGESILVEPGGFLYKDASVQMNVESQKLSTGLFGGVGMNLAKMTGPGRVAIQSMYVHHGKGE